MPVFSVVTPVYGAPDCLEELHRRVTSALSPLSEDFELIMVNDASPDASWEVITRLAAQDPRVKGVNLSRNFGQHVALAAGLDRARGDWVFVMDCDLQDRPEELQPLYARAREGFDVVLARRANRTDGFLKKLGSRAFHAVLGWLSGAPFDPQSANFSVSSGQVIREFKKLRERNRSFPLLLGWLGFKVGHLDVQHGERFAGESSYSLGRMLRLASQAITMHTNRPLELSIRFGLGMALFSVLYAAWRALRYFLFGVTVEGWTSVIVSIYFLSGLLFANLGVVGLYLGRVFDETKARPLYVVRDELNLGRPAE